MLPLLDRNFEKSFKKPLTFSQKCDRMNMKTEEGKPHKPERITTMKKATLQSLVAYLDGQTIDNLPEIKAELEAELNKGAEAKAQSDALYESAKGVVMDELAMATEGVTISELYDAIADKLPEGFSKGKLQYAVTRLWKDEIVRTEGKVNTYRKA